jgi:IPT/TIG domain
MLLRPRLGPSRFARRLLWRGGTAVLLLGTALALTAAAPAAATSVQRPLPSSNYAVRPLCGTPAPGQMTCFSLELVPQTAAARKRDTPIGMTLHHAIEPGSAADGALGLRPQDLHGAYGLPTEAPVEQTIGIVDAYDDPTVEEDLATYDEEFTLPECTKANGCFEKVNQAGEEAPLPEYESGWAGEIALDVETAHAICQEKCRILLVEAQDSSTSALEAAEETAVRLGATEISNSFGGPEPASQGSAFNHPGIAITASTGDYGYLNWTSPYASYVGHPNYPASSPDVVAVGGTRLGVNAGRWTGETVWNDGSTVNGGAGAGGGGCSEHATAQAWQQNVPDWSEVGCGTSRAAADVAADGDPYTGVAVYRDGNWSPVGGTSLASPIIAATFALAGGTGGVAYPAKTLYGHLDLGSSSLHDVKSGSNGQCGKEFEDVQGISGCTTEEEEKDCDSTLICRAAEGYDGPSGIGTPEGLGAFTPPAPSVTAISPSEGDLGTLVTITGEDLKGVRAVKFGAAEATSVVEDSAGELTVMSPGHSPGQVDVTVETAGGGSATSEADRFTYLPNPAIASVEPAAGSTAGGASVTIEGERLDEVESVKFGEAEANVVAGSATELTVTSPAHAEGQVDVSVETEHGASAATSLDRFTYFAPPIVSAVEPSTGSVGGGTTVTVRGEHLHGVSAVKFGAAEATSVVEDSSTELTVRSPAHGEGQVDVAVTTPGGTSATSEADRFTYLKLPVIDGIGPTEGPLAGGTSVMITGEYLGEVESIKFGEAEANVVAGSATELTVTSPAHAAGAVDVTVTTPVGRSEIRSADEFTYVAAPVNETPPTIAGYPMEGRTLRAENGTWENGPTSYAYQWLLCNASGESCSSIEGATAQAYTVTSEDLGHTLKVEVTASNAGGHGTATSAPTGEIVARTIRSFTWSGETSMSGGGGEDPRNWSEGTNWEGGVAPSESVDIGTLSFPAISGEAACATVQEDACYQSINDLKGMEVEKISIDDLTPQGYKVAGEPITLGSGGIEGKTTPAAEFGLFAYLSMPITLSADQTWSISGSPTTISGGGVELGGPITGGSHTVKMKFENRGGIGLATSGADSEMGEVSVEGANPALTGGEAFKNGLLSFALPASLREPLPELNATDGSAVRVKDADIGGAATIGPLTVSGGLVDPGNSHPPEGLPFSFLNVRGAISLDSKTTAWFGLRAGGAIAGEDNSKLTATGDVTLGGAQLQIFTDAADDECPALTVGDRYTIVSAGGSVEGTFGGIPDGSKIEPICLNGVQPVMEINYTEHSVTATVLEPKPVNTSKPTISGNPVEGETLSATEGAWEHNPTSFSYQWLRCEFSCSPISGATSQTYTLTSGDAGHTVAMEVKATNSGGTVTATSVATGPVLPRPPANTGAPTITGIPVEGAFLLAEHGSWERDPTASYAYQWLRCNASGEACVEIPGAISQTYTLTSGDPGHTVVVEVKATNTGGTGSATSAPMLIYPLPPTATSSPTISGNPVEGETLSATEGAWEHNPTSFSYQWLRCESSSCSPISGATSQTYTLTAADVGHEIEVEVAATNAGGSDSSISSHTAAIGARPSEGSEGSGGSGGSGGGGSTGGGGSGGGGTGGGGSGGGGNSGRPAAGTAVAGAMAPVKGGKAAIVLRCSGGGACGGNLLIEVASTGKPHRSRQPRRGALTIGRASFSIPAGGHETVSAHLTAKGWGLVRKAGKRGLEAVLAGAGVAAGHLKLQAKE